jgi:hypothetical protein
MLDQVLSTTTDIVPLRVDRDRVTFAFPFQGEIAKHYFDKTLEDHSERGVEGFSGHWEYNSKTGLIEGLNSNHLVRLSTKTSPDGIRVPTIQEAIILGQKGKLTNNGYRIFGIVVCSDKNPNQDVANELKKGFNGDLPLITSFRNLNYRLDDHFSNGIAITLSNDSQGIISGKEAIEYLVGNHFHLGNSAGACWVDLNGHGERGADWSRLDYSDRNGRVDWMVAEGPCTDIESAYTGNKGVLDREINAKISILETERDPRKKSFLESLK